MKSQLSLKGNEDRKRNARWNHGFRSHFVKFRDRTEKNRFKRTVCAAAKAIIEDAFLGKAVLKNTYGTVKVDKLSPASHNIYYSEDIIDAGLNLLPHEVCRCYYAYTRTTHKLGWINEKCKSTASMSILKTLQMPFGN